MLDLLTLDKKGFNKPIIRKKLMGLPTVMQFRIQSKIWLALSRALMNELTTESVLVLHFK